MTTYKRSTQMYGNSHKVEVACGTLYIIVNKEQGQIKEVFAILGKAGTCFGAQVQALSRAISIGLQNGVPVQAFIDTLKGIRCNEPVMGQEHILSCADAISKILEKELKDNDK